MEIYRGTGVSKGVSIGVPHWLAAQEREIPRTLVDDREAELARFHLAQAQAAAQQELFYQKTLEKATAQEAEVFQIHAMLIADPDFTEEVEKLILEQGVCAEYAAQQVSRQFSQMFAQLEDAYMQARPADFCDVGNQILAALLGEEAAAACGGEPYILFAEDLLPSQAVQLDLDAVQAFVTRQGSSVSHTAILARNMGIPAVVGVKFPDQLPAGPVVVDGEKGEVIFNPSPEVLLDYQRVQQAQRSYQEQLLAYRDQPSVTPAGQKIGLYANIGSPGDLQAVLENGAEGIGLFRSEFLYMDAQDFPPEEEQYRRYREVLEGMQGKRVIIRTLDLGADKQLGYCQFGKEENPALGCRAIRFCLRRRDVFLTQLRALLRASPYGRLAIMLPMVVSLEEVRESKRLLQEAKAQLQAEGYPVAAQIEFGIMIETPAAALISRELAAEVDFFSVGTNDLTQYTLAVDRMNGEVSNLYDPAHPAVLRLIKEAAERAREAGIWIGICGEAAADPKLLPFFLEIGIAELSMSPKSILGLRRRICTYQPDEAAR